MENSFIEGMFWVIERKDLVNKAISKKKIRKLLKKKGKKKGKKVLKTVKNNSKMLYNKLNKKD
jgi:hypothetical protein